VRGDRSEAKARIFREKGRDRNKEERRGSGYREGGERATVKYVCQVLSETQGEKKRLPSRRTGGDGSSKMGETRRIKEGKKQSARNKNKKSKRSDEEAGKTSGVSAKRGEEALWVENKPGLSSVHGKSEPKRRREGAGCQEVSRRFRWGGGGRGSSGA